MLLSLNRTFVELKHVVSINRVLSYDGLNRTFVELKHEDLVAFQGDERS